MKKILLQSCTIFFLLITWHFYSGCNENDEGLAPYTGNREMSNIQIEQGVYKPKITWVGGYASVLGINRDTVAALDSSLIWLIRIDGNNLHYPVRFGELPEGAVDITSQYGGNKLDSLSEDFTYTYWVLEAEVWDQISSQNGKKIVVDNSLGDSPVIIEEDTLRISSESAVQKTQSIDVYININNVQALGRLAEINVTPTNVSNNVVLSWTIRQNGITDSSIAAIGLVEGQQYQALFTLWEVYSEEFVDGNSVLGRSNIIAPPILLGESFPGTRVFEEFPSEGLERNKDYLVWIAAKDWDQSGRIRSTNHYAWVTFHTW